MKQTLNCRKIYEIKCVHKYQSKNQQVGEQEVIFNNSMSFVWQTHKTDIKLQGRFQDFHRTGAQVLGKGKKSWQRIFHLKKWNINSKVWNSERKLRLWQTRTFQDGCQASIAKHQRVPRHPKHLYWSRPWIVEKSMKLSLYIPKQQWSHGFEFEGAY